MLGSFPVQKKQKSSDCTAVFPESDREQTNSKGDGSHQDTPAHLQHMSPHQDTPAHLQHMSREFRFGLPEGTYLKDAQWFKTNFPVSLF